MPGDQLSWQVIHISTVFPNKRQVTTSHYATAISLNILFNLLFTNQPNVRRYTLRDTDGTVRQTININLFMTAENPRVYL
jgi:hypothetical protein